MKDYLSANQASQIAKQARYLRRDGKITPHQHSLLDTMLWSCRTPGRGAFKVSLRRMAKLARQCKDTVIAGIEVFEALGLLVKRKHRVRVKWLGAKASRQATNEYQFAAPATESTGSTVYRGQASSLLLSAPNGRKCAPKPDALDDALGRLQRAMTARSVPT